MGRHLEFDKDEALERALEVFWSNGYEATSLRDLLQATDLSKSSFYQSFSSKYDLFQRCLSRYRNALALDIVKRLKKAPSSYGFIRDYLYDIAGGSMSHMGQKGCMFMNTASEFARRAAVLAAQIKDGLQQLEEALRSVIEQAREEGDIPADKDAKALAGFLLTTIGGMKSMAKAGASREKLESVAAIALTTLK